MRPSRPSVGFAASSRIRQSPTSPMARCGTGRRTVIRVPPSDLSPEPRPAAAVIYNPVKVPVDELHRAVEAQEQLQGWAPSRWYETTADDPGGELARAALTEHPAVVIVAGGDGTVRAVAEAVAPSGTPLALAPAGTGNLLARNMNLTITDLEHSIGTAFTGTDRPVDIASALFARADGTTERHSFLVMAGIGLDAYMAENTNAALKARVGWLAYTAPIASSVVRNRQFSMHYRVDGGRTRSARTHTVIVGNCGTLTANILLLPDAVIDDGLLDAVILRPTNAAGWARIASRLAFHGLLHRSRFGRRLMKATPELGALRYAQARRLDVRFDAPQLIELDGDGFGEVVAAKLTVRHHGLLVRVPADQG